MKSAIFFVSFLPLVLVAQEPESSFSIPPSMSVFSLTAEEMVFASKLSDENRHRFCYQFSSKERLQCLSHKKSANDLSCDQIVQLLQETFPR